MSQMFEVRWVERRLTSSTRRPGKGLIKVRGRREYLKEHGLKRHFRAV
jgi:hypothetical protein